MGHTNVLVAPDTPTIYRCIFVKSTRMPGVVVRIALHSTLAVGANALPGVSPGAMVLWKCRGDIVHRRKHHRRRLRA
jgi:hypothetical protein